MNSGNNSPRRSCLYGLLVIVGVWLLAATLIICIVLISGWPDAIDRYFNRSS